MKIKNIRPISMLCGDVPSNWDALAEECNLNFLDETTEAWGAVWIHFDFLDEAIQEHPFIKELREIQKANPDFCGIRLENT